MRHRGNAEIEPNLRIAYQWLRSLGIWMSGWNKERGLFIAAWRDSSWDPRPAAEDWV